MTDEEPAVHPAVTVADKVGAKVAEHVAKASAANAATETARRYASTLAIAESIRDDIKPAMTEMFGAMIDKLPDGDPTRKFYELFMSPESVLNDAIINIIGFIGMVKLAISETGTVFFQPLLNELWASRPRLPLSPADLAIGAVRGILPGDPAITHYPSRSTTSPTSRVSATRTCNSWRTSLACRRRRKTSSRCTGAASSRWTTSPPG